MELRQYINLVWKWLWLLILAALIAAGASYLASRAATPLYSTRTTLMVGQVTQNPEPNSFDIYTSQQLAHTYIELSKPEPVLQGAIDSLGLQMSWQYLANQLSASSIAQTQLLEINLADSDPFRAKALADAIAQQLILLSPANPNKIGQDNVEFTQEQLTDLQTKIESAQGEIDGLRAELDAASSARQIQDLQNRLSILESKINTWQITYSQLLTTLQGGDINTISVVEEASIPTHPFSPNIPMNVATAAAIGLVLALAGILLIEYLDDTIKSPDDVERTMQLPTLGMIARIDGKTYSDKLVAEKAPLAPVVEAYRILRTNLQFSSIDNPAHTVMMTSPNPSEGKSITLANLGVVIARAGQRVIVVDTDMRRPVQHRIFAKPNRYGLNNVILDPSIKVADRLQQTGIQNLQLLTSGPLPPNPSELLGSERMKAIIKELEESADIILFDCPPSLVVADAAILSADMDGVILVTDAGRTRSKEAQRTVAELKRVRAKLLGVVLNRLQPRRSGYYYYYHYYSSDGRNKKPPKRQKSSRLPGKSQGVMKGAPPKSK